MEMGVNSEGIFEKLLFLCKSFMVVEYLLLEYNVATCEM